LAKELKFMPFSKRSFKWSIAVVSVTMAAALSAPAFAQAPGFRRPSIDAQAFNACTTTDYTGLIAKALNITPATLRKDIVSGQTLQDIATSANVDIQAVVTAYRTARQADIDQAVKDGVMTQDEATALEATPPAPSGTAPANPPGQGNGGQRGNGGQPNIPFPDISTFRMLLQTSPATAPAPGAGFGGGIGLGIGAGTFNLVKQYAVAAQAVNVKCTDLVKTLITPPGKSVLDVAKTQNVDAQTVIDALTKAYTAALAQDVTDGIITQAEADQLTPIVDKAVTAFVGNSLPMGIQATPTPQS
jgi:hypothetical protein